MRKKRDRYVTSLNSPFHQVREQLLQFRDIAPVHVSIPRHCSGDEDLFREAMRDVVPIPDKEKRAALHRKVPLEPTTCPCPDSVESIQKLFHLIDGVDPIDPSHLDEYLCWRSPELNPLAFERLRSGLYPIQAVLDLHHLRADEGEEATRQFLWDRYVAGLSCVLIVHGKGNNSRNREPVLKRRLFSWLRSGVTGKIVLAFASAKGIDGGLGALYVLLSPSGKIATAEKIRMMRKRRCKRRNNGKGNGQAT